LFCHQARRQYKPPNIDPRSVRDGLRIP